MATPHARPAHAAHHEGTGATAAMPASGHAVPQQRWLPARCDRIVVAILLLAWLLLYGPTYHALANGIWAREEHSYGPVILAASFWLMWQDRERLAALALQPRVASGYTLAALSLLAYAIGRSQDILIFEVGSQITLLVALALLFIGWRAVALLTTPLVTLFFVIPLPGDLVAAVTAPLKGAVSAVAADVMHAAGYPVARSGVILSVGQYQLLVADACAGLTSMFTLEALGLVYIKLMGYTSRLRNALLLTLLVPIAFLANVIRVVFLCLITYYLGDAAGQGFMHSAAGLVLFLVATLLMLATDRVLGLLPAVRRTHAPQGAGI